MGKMRIFGSRENVGDNGEFRPSARGQVDEESPLLSRTGSEESSHSRYSASFKLASAVTIVFSLFLLSLGVAVYREVDMEKVHAEIKLVENTELQTAPYDLCALNSKVHASLICASRTTKFYVDADDNGKWPAGFSWTVLKDTGNSQQGERSFLHLEKGEFNSELSAGKDIRCKKFVTELCLSGNYVVYANSDEPSSSAASVSVCNSAVAVDEALDFEADNVKCVGSSVHDAEDLKADTSFEALSLSLSTSPQPPPASPGEVIKQGWDVSVNTTTTFANETVHGFKYPTAAPTVFVSSAPPTLFNQSVLSQWANNVSHAIVEGWDNTVEFSNETVRGFRYPTASPTVASSLPANYTNCYMFGLICDKDFQKVGFTGSPTSQPSALPPALKNLKLDPAAAEVSAAPVASAGSGCYLFGLICPSKSAVTADTDTAAPVTPLEPVIIKSSGEISPSEADSGALRIADLRNNMHGKLRRNN
jgi:hypothetical protein